MSKPRKRKPRVRSRKLTEQEIDFYLTIAAKTVKEVERGLESAFRLPQGLIGLKIRGSL